MFMVYFTKYVWHLSWWKSHLFQFRWRYHVKSRRALRTTIFCFLEEDERSGGMWGFCSIPILPAEIRDLIGPRPHRSFSSLRTGRNKGRFSLCPEEQHSMDLALGLMINYQFKFCFNCWPWESQCPLFESLHQFSASIFLESKSSFP